MRGQTCPCSVEQALIQPILTQNGARDGEDSERGETAQLIAALSGIGPSLDRLSAMKTQLQEVHSSNGKHITAS